MKNLSYPVTVTASLKEYAKMNKDGELQATWKTKTCLMIEKIAIVRALKEAMTEEFGGTYAAEEFGESEENIESKVDDIPTKEVQETKAPKIVESTIKEAEFVEVDEDTGEVVDNEQDVEDMEFEAMQNSFFN